MILDGALLFEPITGTAITVSANSTNILDLVANRDLGGGFYPAPIIVVGVLAAFASATASATLTINVQGAPDSGTGLPGGYTGVAGGFQTLQATPAIPLGQLLKGQRPLKLQLATVSEFPLPPINTVATSTLAGNTVVVASAAGLLQGMNVFGNPNIPPGTTIASIAGTTVTLSTGVGVTAATLVATSFGAPEPKPRFLQLQYTCSATFTAGSIWAGIVLDDDIPALYAPGYTWPANA
jgi:hypothetical protein